MSFLLFIIFVQEIKAQDSLAHYTVSQLDSLATVCYKKEMYAAILPYAEAAYKKGIKKDENNLVIKIIIIIRKKI